MWNLKTVILKNPKILRANRVNIKTMATKTFFGAWCIFLCVRKLLVTFVWRCHAFFGKKYSQNVACWEIIDIFESRNFCVVADLLTCTGGMVIIFRGSIVCNVVRPPCKNLQQMSFPSFWNKIQSSFFFFCITRYCKV